MSKEIHRIKHNISLKEFLEKKEIISSHRKSWNVVNPVHRSYSSIFKTKGFPSSGGKLLSFPPERHFHFFFEEARRSIINMK